MSKKGKIKKLNEMKRAFCGRDLVDSITDALTSPTSRILYLMNCDDSTNEEPIINMAIARAVYLAYHDGDIKRLDWLLGKIGIREIESIQQTSSDLSKINNETILKVLKK